MVFGCSNFSLYSAFTYVDTKIQKEVRHHSLLTEAKSIRLVIFCIFIIVSKPHEKT